MPQVEAAKSKKKAFLCMYCRNLNFMSVFAGSFIQLSDSHRISKSAEDAKIILCSFCVKKIKNFEVILNIYTHRRFDTINVKRMSS